MKKHKITILSIILVFVALIGIYFCISIHISSVVNEMMEENYNNYGKNISEKYSDFISDDDYAYACYRINDSHIASEKNDTKFPFTFWWCDKATVYYNYVYVAYDQNNELLYSFGSNITEPITIKFTLVYKNGNWRVEDVCESL